MRAQEDWTPWQDALLRELCPRREQNRVCRLPPERAHVPLPCPLWCARLRVQDTVRFEGDMWLCAFLFFFSCMCTRFTHALGSDFSAPYCFSSHSLLVALVSCCTVPHRCLKCRRRGHNPLTIALDPRLFKRNITEKGVSFTKKPHTSLALKYYVCPATTVEFVTEEMSRARADYAAADAVLNQKAAQREGLVANIAEAAAPVREAISTLRNDGSAAASLAPSNLAATAEQTVCADAGLSAVSSALAGAITAATGRASGVTDDDAAARALSTLQGRQVEDNRARAKRLKTATAALAAPTGSYRMYVSLRVFSESRTSHGHFLSFLFAFSYIRRRRLRSRFLWICLLLLFSWFFS
eukprot:TRINITY_DN635_c0_g1_i10.p1 TRINITY_DN635_c0_g1~~TRINITY_DN635_c0_g1_i10.p1  ORF type:complete len:354 (+),score=2.53 TRINITY_DN635_c0_g1_i10:287-1348(+)